MVSNSGSTWPTAETHRAAPSSPGQLSSSSSSSSVLCLVLLSFHSNFSSHQNPQSLKSMCERRRGARRHAERALRMEKYPQKEVRACARAGLGAGAERSESALHALLLQTLEPPRTSLQVRRNFFFPGCCGASRAGCFHRPPPSLPPSDGTD